jgi:hypothetical protein
LHSREETKPAKPQVNVRHIAALKKKQGEETEYSRVWDILDEVVQGEASLKR